MPPTFLRRLALSLSALVALGFTAVSADIAAADGTAAQCVADGNVWIHVEHDDVVNGACATEFSTGTEAMVTTGLATDQGDFFTTVDGVTATDPQWWSLWTADVVGGEMGEWEFSQVGVGDLVPEPGQVMGWRLLADYNQPQEAPVNNPLEAPADPTPDASPADPSASAIASEEPSPTPVEDAEESPSTDSAATSAPSAEADVVEGADSEFPLGTVVGVGAVVALAAAGGIVWWRRRGQ